MSVTPPLVFGRYETRVEWARGSQGRLFLGRDRSTGDAVALKVWRLGTDADRRAFESEAEMVAAVPDHPHLPAFVDRLVDGEHGVLVTGWVEGRDLDRVLAKDGEPGLAPSLVLAYLDQAAAALDCLHDLRPPLVHGDVKPANLIVTPEGTVVLVDFGSADRFGRHVTPGFGAPELAAGQAKTGASDRYALAATALTLLTGTAPVEGPVLDGLDPATAGAVVEGLRAGLAVDPASRPPRAADVVADLRRALADADALGPADDGGPSRGRQEGEEQPCAPLPPLLDGRGRPGYVGRHDLLRALSDTRAATRRQGCQTVVLAGEPGAGKTRTAAELAGEAAAAGATVLYGGCRPEHELPYEPFAEALRWQVAHEGGRRLGPLAGELVRLVPELDRFVPDLPPALATDPRLEEHRTWDAVADWLLAASEPCGLVLVIDDLHWATRATLCLFQHVLLRATAAGPAAPILFVGTYRPTDLEEGHPLLEFLPALAQATRLRELALGGLDEQDVSALLVELSGERLDEVARRVVRELTGGSGGNPLFAIETLRHLLESGTFRPLDGHWRLDGGIELPPDVRSVLASRFERLGERAQSSLSAASVIGMDFDVPLLTTLAGMARAETLAVLDALLGMGLLEESEPERFRFEHALVRSTLYEALDPTERRRAHGRVVEALLALDRRHPATLATHALEAASDGPALARALDYALAAGEEAFAARAFSDAEAWSRRVLDLADHDASLHGQRVRGLCLLGEAERDQGRPEFRETLLLAGDEAARAGLADLTMRSAIANYRGTVSIVGKLDEPRVARLRQALALEPDPHSRQWALLAATLAGDLTYDPATPVRARLDLVERARAVARASGDDSFLLDVLLRTMAPAAVPDGLPALVASGRELVALADATGDPSLRVLARWAATTTHLPAGEFDEFRRYLEEADEASRENCPPRIRWFAGAARPQFLAGEGDLASARAANDECLGLGELAAEPDAPMLWSAVSFGLALLEGTAGDLADLAGENAAAFPEFPVWQIGHTVALGAAGRRQEGLAVVARHRLREVGALPFDVLTLACWSLLAQAAVHLGDVDLAVALEPVLRSHAEAWGHSSVWVLGPIPWDVGRCCLVRRDWDGAVAALADAVERCEAQRLPAHAAVCRADLVRALLARDGRRDRQYAQRERARALAVVTDIGLTRRREELEALPV